MAVIATLICTGCVGSLERYCRGVNLSEADARRIANEAMHLSRYEFTVEQAQRTKVDCEANGSGCWVQYVLDPNVLPPGPHIYVDCRERATFLPNM